MLDKSKTDPKLGREIHQLLHDTGIETPMIDSTFQTESEKFTAIRDSFKTIMQTLGMDLTDDSLLETPNRIAKMYLNEIFWGLDYNNFPKVTTIDNKMQYNSMLLERNIKVSSFCEHHFVNFVGSAYVAYIPHGKIIGLSKINRIVEFFCRRPQVQERLCEQIWAALCHVLETEDIAVLIRAEHFCVKSRGVEDINSDTVTSRLGGLFYDNEQRDEFYKVLNFSV